MPLQNLSCFYVMAEAAIAQTTTFLRRIYRNWQLKSVLKLEEHRYPPYTSKFNPIEHRLFPHVTRACQGAIFTSIELVKSLIEKTSTKTGLSRPVGKQKQCLEQILLFPSVFKKRPNRSSISQPHST